MLKDNELNCPFGYQDSSPCLTAECFYSKPECQKNIFEFCSSNTNNLGCVEISTFINNKPPISYCITGDFECYSNNWDNNMMVIQKI